MQQVHNFLPTSALSHNANVFAVGRSQPTGVSRLLAQNLDLPRNCWRGASQSFVSRGSLSITMQKTLNIGVTAYKLQAFSIYAKVFCTRIPNCLLILSVKTSGIALSLYRYGLLYLYVMLRLLQVCPREGQVICRILGLAAIQLLVLTICLGTAVYCKAAW